MSREHEKMMAQLSKLISSQNFENEQELQSYLNHIMLHGLPEPDQNELTPEEMAVDLVFEAYDDDPDEAKHKVNLALILDSHCIEAYEWLGLQEDMPAIAAVFFEKGIAIGRKKFGGSYQKKNKGHFWGLIETRPFMRCMQLYADCCQALDKTAEAVTHYEELMQLNPNDNQGVRYHLMLGYILLNENKKFERLAAKFNDDVTAFSAFNLVLYSFKTKGICEETETLLNRAKKANKFVVKELLLKRRKPYFNTSYQLGAKSEAEHYSFYAKQVWEAVPGAIDWLGGKTQTLQVTKGGK
jgi:tetratricopeptide (TPR) repeat protein